MLENFAPPSIWLIEDAQFSLDLELLWSALLGIADGVYDGFCPSWQGS